MLHRPFRSSVILTLGLALTLLGALRFGLVPPRLNPLAPITLAEPAPWFLDFRLAALKRDPALCRAVLKAPVIVAAPINDQAVRNGCGWNNAVRVTSAGRALVPVGTLTCEMAAALAMWTEHAVQPAAVAHFGQRVTALQHMGSYSCRNIIGNRPWRAHRSQHARANALDISGFRLEDGTIIHVLKGWKVASPSQDFLRDIHRNSCRYFRAALSPAFNDAHANHLHLDRGAYTSCR
jgi:hypothetical protein